MPQFAYRAKDSALKIVEGTIEADNEASAISRLGTQGIFPSVITETGGAVAASALFAPRRVAPQTLAYTTRQLADLLAGGLPLLNALTLLAKQTEHRGLQHVIEGLAAAVRDGRSLSEALSSHPEVFPSLYISMVRAGEAGGALEQALARLAELGEHEAELRSRIVMASVYPFVVLCIAFAMTLFLMTYVIPKLAVVFEESGQLLPLPTRMLLGVSHALTQWWWLLAALMVVVGWALKQWYQSPGGRVLVDKMLMTLPGVGLLVRKLETARFTRNLGNMISQGVPVLQALGVVTQNVGNSILRSAVTQVEALVRDGSSIAAALEHSGQFPPFVSNMVAIGEESGTVDSALLKVSATYEREVDRTMRALTTVLEPVLLVLVAGVVMFIVLAMLLPVFQIGLVLQ